MSESQQSDHWDLLASALGAEPPKKEPVEPIPQAEKPKVSETIIVQPEVIKPPIEPVPRSSPRSLSNWDALAMELGLEVKSEPPPPPASSFSPPPQKVEKPPIAPMEQTSKAGRPSSAEFTSRSEHHKERPTSSADDSAEPSEKKSRHRRRRHHKDKDKDRPVAGISTYKSDLQTQTQDKVDLDAMLSEVSMEMAENAGVPVEEGIEIDKSEKQRQKHRRPRRGLHKRKKRETNPPLKKLPISKNTDPQGKPSQSQKVI